MKKIEFFVQGKPQPAGSKRGFAIKKGGQYTGRVAIVDANKKSGDWKMDCKHAANQAYQGPLIGVAIILHVDFWFHRPKSHFGTGKNSRILKPGADLRWHTKKPDTTKLLRGIEDALTGVIWIDDSQIIEQRARKFYVFDNAQMAGAQVMVGIA